MLTTILSAIVPRDGGHIYAETNFNHIIVEPYNAISAFLFFGIGIYWFYRLKGRYEQFAFLTTAVSLLTIGAIGGTIYHAFRLHAFFMYMDWLPILIICFMTSVYFLDKILGVWYYALGLVVIALLSQFLLFKLVHSSNIINLNYGVMAALVLVPTILILIKHKFFQWWWVIYALGGFSLALFFRVADKWFDLPMGTHFLWHLFGAMTGHFMFLFIFKLNEKESAQII